jgi:hypothetical protein
VQLDEAVDPARFVIGLSRLDDFQKPFERGHVFDQFKPALDCRRPGLKTR